MSNPQHTIDLLADTFELMRGKIDIESWLNKFAAAANAESALCIRWGCGMPEKTIHSVSGDYNQLPAGFSNWADHVVNVAKPDSCMLLTELLSKLNRPDFNEACPLNDPQLIVGIVDWGPSYIFMMIHRDVSKGSWQADEIEHFKTLCELSRRAILVHKEFSRSQNLATATADILNSAPRGIVAISVDGRVQFANSMATRLLAENDGLTIKNQALFIEDRECRSILTDFIATAKILMPQQMTYENKASYRDCSIPRPSGSIPYQIMMTAVPLSSWSVEVSPSDRMILIYINDPQNRLQPTEDQLKSLYNLTNAQARVAVRLYAVDNLVAVSEFLGISINTARSHLRTIYAKTGAKNQAELIKLLTATLKPNEGFRH
jgi:DNA-binding CsgD family transcriptional regulator